MIDMVTLFVQRLWTRWFTDSIINELASSMRYGEPVGSTTVNSLVRWQIINHSFKNHTLCSYSRLNTQFRNKSKYCQWQTLTTTFVPQRSIKLTFGFIFADAVSFLLLVRFEVAANINHTVFFGTGSGYGKVKKTRQFLTFKNKKGMRSRM